MGWSQEKHLLPSNYSLLYHPVHSRFQYQICNILQLSSKTKSSSQDVQLSFDAPLVFEPFSFVLVKAMSPYHPYQALNHESLVNTMLTLTENRRADNFNPIVITIILCGRRLEAATKITMHAPTEKYVLIICRNL